MKELYVKGLRVDIEEDLNIPINYVIEDVYNPSAIKTDYSISVKIPGTVNNNNIFGQLYNFNVNNSFNPSKKNDVILYEDGLPILKGYIKINNIINNNGNIVYECSLHDKIAEFMQSLKDKKMIDLRYTINGVQSNLQHVVDKNTIKRNWESSLDDGTIDGVVKYTPCVQGCYDNFDSKKLTIGDSKSNLKELKYDYNVNEWEARIFRSSKQRISISVKKTIQAILNNSGYEYRLGAFFDDSNPYWSKTFKMCEDISKRESTATAISNLRTYGDGSGERVPYLSLISGIQDVTFKENVGGDNLLLLTQTRKLDLSDCAGEDINIKGTVELDITEGFLNSEFFERAGYINMTNDIKIKTVVKYGKKNEELIKEFIYSGRDIEFYKEAYSNKLSSRLHTDINDFYFTFKNDYPVFEMYTEVVNSRNEPAKFMDSDTGVIQNVNAESIILSIVSKTSNFTITSKTKNTDVNIIATTNELFNKEETQFDFLVNYLKMFNLYIQKNNDVIEIMDINEFYNSGKLLNWNNKIVKSEEVNINPLVFDKSKLLIGYAPAETNSFFKQYKTSIGVNYGDKVALTGYEFNKDELRVLQSFNSYPPLITDNNMLSYGYISFNTPAVDGANVKVKNWINIQAPSFYTVEGNERKKSDGRGEYFFWAGEYYKDGLVNYSTSIDDFGGERINDNNKKSACYTHVNYDTYSYVICDKVPIFKTITDNCSLDFAKPNIIYYDVTDVEYPESYTIYYKYWDKWIRDRYNIKAKLIDLTLMLTLKDIKEFKFNDLVYLQGRYWCVQKISNFIKDKPTKVTLLLVSNINNYKTN